jgi:hypothetical protein
MIALMLIAAAGLCPFAPERWVSIRTKKDLPTGAVEVIGDMAEKGGAFQVSDAIGQHLPFTRFMSARGRGCALVVHYEKGGIAYRQLTMRLRFEAGRWVKVVHPAGRRG